MAYKGQLVPLEKVNLEMVLRDCISTGNGGLTYSDINLAIKMAGQHADLGQIIDIIDMMQKIKKPKKIN